MSVAVRPLRKDTTGKRWQVDIIFVWPEDRTRYRERVRAPVTSKAAALRWGDARERSLLSQGKAAQTPAPPVKEVPTLDAFLPRYIDEYARANRHKASGVATKERIVRLHYQATFGARRLDEITDPELQAWKARPETRALGRKTLNNVLNVLSSILNVAQSWGVIDRVPCTIKLVKAPSPVAPFYDFDDYARLVTAAGEVHARCRLMVLLGGDAGLRRGEMLALRHSDVDLARRKLVVRRSIWDAIEDLPKGGRERSVNLTLELAEALRVRGTGRPGNARVLVDDDGDDMDANGLQLWMKEATARAGLTPSRALHILRHTFCSHLAMRGAPARAIQSAAGHSSISTTERYMHLSPAAEEGAIRLLDDARAEARARVERVVERPAV